MKNILIRGGGLAALLPAAALGWWATGVSPVLGAAVFVLVLVALGILMHNFDGILSRPLLARDDQILFHFCEDTFKKLQSLNL